ncbi:MAG: X-Pro dipeptidyl-peptidase, partial [Acidobacteria bacterium]
MFTSSKRLAVRVCFALVLFTLPLYVQPGTQKSSPAERQQYYRSNYTKYEHMIPMRDGVRLFTVVYAPKDASQAYPILLQRTPYSVAPYGIDNYEEPPA